MAHDAGRLVFFDLETAGPRPARNPIIQMAAIAVDGQLNQLETFEVKLLFDEKKADRQSLRKNHYNRGTWAREAVYPDIAAARLADFLRRHASQDRVSARGESYRVAQLVAHNAAFDGPFITTWFEKLDLFLPAHRHNLCTLQRAQWFFAERPHLPPPTSFSLASLCRYFGVPFHAADAHEALGDVAATLELYRALRLTLSASALRTPLPMASCCGQ